MNGPTDSLTLAERIVTLFAEGSFSATYKHAVLLALIDLCFEKTSTKGAPPTSVTTRELAEAVLALYWPQCVPWRQGRQLRQGGGTNEQAEILSDIVAARRRLGRKDSQPLVSVRRESPEAYEQLVRRVEWKLIQMPLPRLQVIGRGEDRFLYEYNWTTKVPKADVSAYQRGTASGFDNALRLKPGVAAGLIALNGLLRPLIQREWLRLVQQFNDEPESQLEAFLFRREREQLDKARDPLLDLQNGRCFFCDGRLAEKGEVDHFIPWARVPNNAVENLVVAHQSCNHHKLDFLAAAPHVARWSQRLAESAADLRTIGESLPLGSDADRSRGIAAALYLALPGGSPLWLKRKDFERLDVPVIRAALGAA